MQETKPTRAGTPWRIMILDDHPLVRAGLQSLIEQQADMELCAEAGSIREGMAVVAATKPDLLITDLTLADGNGLDLVQRLHVRDPDLRILVCSIHDEMLFARRALNVGASGYLNKSEATSHIVEAIRRVLEGGIWLSPAMTERLVRAAAGGKEAVSENEFDTLTTRELEVFRLIGEGLGPSDIAERLCLSVKTVETHREKIKRKLALKNGSELTRRAVQWVLEQN